MHLTFSVDRNACIDTRTPGESSRLALVRNKETSHLAVPITVSGPQGGEPPVISIRWILEDRKTDPYLLEKDWLYCSDSFGRAGVDASERQTSSFVRGCIDAALGKELCRQRQGRMRFLSHAACG